MKFFVISFYIFALNIIYFDSVYSQDPSDLRRDQYPRNLVNLSGEYVTLPNSTDTETKQFTFETNKTSTPIGVMVTYPNIRVLPSGNQQSENTVVSNPVNRNILFAASHTIAGSYLNSGIYVSTDGGVSWSGTESLIGAPTYDQRGDPGPVISKNGIFLYSHLTSATNFGTPTGLGVNRSTDNGATWSSTYQIVSDPLADKNLAGTDDYPLSPYYGQSYLVWTSFTSPSAGTGQFSKTTDDGLSWSAPLNINNSIPGHYSQALDVSSGPGGEVYVNWMSALNYAPYTEKFMGFAKSINGGNSFTVNENVYAINGISVGPNPGFNGWGIRANSFPRMAVDKTGGVRNGWIYVVLSEINHAPAGSDADVVLYRSTNGGTTWSGGIRVNQDALNNGKAQFFPAVCVDSDGGVNVVYYDNRLFPGVGDSCSVYISRSIDGAFTFNDVKISDHNFKPKPSLGIGGGYMGDYIGITESVGKVVAVWMDDKAGIPGIFNVWAGALDITTSTICQDFSGIAFPPSDMELEFTGTQYWTRDTQSAYASGTGSAKFDFKNANAGITQSLVTTVFTAVGAGNYLTFDRAYSPGLSGTDSLIIESSTDGGNTYSNLSRMFGNSNGKGTLNTTDYVNNFSPTSGGQWASNIFILPSGTNKIRFKAVSGNGNNLYLDNICLKSLPNTFNSILSCLPEGFYRANSNPPLIQDTVRVYLHRTDFPNVKVDSAKAFLSLNGSLPNVNFAKALNGNYYIVFKHRNTITTWSSSGGTAYTRGAALNLDLISNLSDSYLNSEKQIDPFPYYGMYSGDITQDGIIDASDLSKADNGAAINLSGYVTEDVNGDNFVDGSDLSIVENNQGVTVSSPPGSAPAP
jgi:hypothetical protein